MPSHTYRKLYILKTNHLSFFYDPIMRGLGKSIFSLASLDPKYDPKLNHFHTEKILTKDQDKRRDKDCFIFQGKASIRGQTVNRLALTDEEDIIIGFGVGSDYADLSSYTEFAKKYPPESIRAHGIRDLPNLIRSLDGYIGFARSREGNQYVRVCAHIKNDQIVLMGSFKVSS